jgi:hypothetical protein
MANRPPLSNGKFIVDGLRDSNGQAMELKAAAYINTAKEDRFDQKKQELVQQIAKLIDDNDLRLRITLTHRVGPDYNNWPVLGDFNLFRPWRDDNAAPAQAPQQSAPSGPTGGWNGGQ